MRFGKIKYKVVAFCCLGERSGSRFFFVSPSSMRAFLSWITYIGFGLWVLEMGDGVLGRHLVFPTVICVTRGDTHNSRSGFFAM